MLRIFLFLLSQTAWAIDVVKDLKPSWLAYENGSYVSVSSITSVPTTIYFRISAHNFKGQYLAIRSSDQWNLFVNGQLLLAGRNHRFDLDSLAQIYSGQLFFGLHGADLVTDIETLIVPARPVKLGGLPALTLRPPFFFRDFAILAVAIMLVFFVGLLRTNPQLTIDYFSFGKIFSVQERNERLLASRIASSVNLLFYLFCALLTGFLLLVIFQFGGDEYDVSRAMVVHSLGQAFATWMRLSLFVLVLLASKLLIVLLFSSLYNFRDTISFQFFNFLRFILFTGLVIAGLILVYFMVGGGQTVFYQRLIVLALILLSIGSVMVLIKLLARAPFSFFHLFSYLCASEIIPLVVIIKIFF